MAKIDMNKVKANTNDSTEIKKSDDAKQAETPAGSDELINNASENAEDTSETEGEAKDTGKTEEEVEKDMDETREEVKTGKVIVSYVGNGIWKDCEGKLWASRKMTENILSERQYTAAEYEKREDIKFMVKYGSMKAINVK